ncbi:MAG: glycosyl hydrolase [Patescibacteria group bacterium]
MLQRLVLFSFGALVISLIGVATFFLHDTQTQAQTNIPNLITCSNLDRPLLLGFMTNGQLNPEYADLISEVGGTAMKQNFNWDNIERVRGEYNFGGFDQMMERANQNNLIVVANISGTPEWAKSSDLPPHKDLPRKEFTQDYQRFVTTLMRRYPNIIAYEFWNEQNGCSSSAGGCGFTDQSVSDYAYWLNATYQAVKAEDQSKLVVLGGLDGIASDDGVGFMEALHSKSGGRSYDIFSTHPYGNNMKGRIDLAGVRDLHQLVQKPVWITEWGWDTNFPGEKAVTEEQQASFTDQDLRELARPEYNFIQAAFFATITDQNDFVKMGLIKREGGQWVKKPAWQVFKNFTAERCPEAGQTSPTPTPAPQPNQPPASVGQGGVQDVPITIRAHFTAQPGSNPNDGSTWPQVALYLNNGGDFNGLNDTADCTTANRPPTCGTPPLFQEKLVEVIGVNSQNFTKDTVVSAQQLLNTHPTINPNLPTKLTYAYINDYWDPNTNTDRDVFINLVELFDPSGQLLLSYNPASASSTTNYYFDMGVINIEGAQTSQQHGMNNAFDKELIFTQDEQSPSISNQNSWSLTQEGGLNIVTTDIPTILRERYPDQSTTPPQSQLACVVSSNSTGGTQAQAGMHLLPNTDLEVSSTASGPIKEFIYAFYNEGNKNENGIAQPFCVTGAPATPDACPEGTGQLIIRAAAGSSPITAFDTLNISNTSSQSVYSSFRGDHLWSRIGSNNWNDIGPITTMPTPEQGHFQDISSVVVGERVFINAWVNNVWYRGLVATSSYSGQEPLLNGARDADEYRWEEIADLVSQPTSLPGWGPIQGFGEFALESHVVQIFWRNNQEFVRTVEIGSSNTPDFGKADAQPNRGFQQIRTTESLPGSGSVRAITYTELSDSQVQEIVWRGHQRFSREINTDSLNSQWMSVNYAVQESDAGLGGDTRGGGIITSFEQIAVADQHADWVAQHGEDAVPEELQINALFLTESDELIRSDARCTSRVLLGEQMPGDYNNDCVIDIYDYNYVLEYFQRQCPMNQGCVSTRQSDLDLVIENFGRICE